MNDKIHIITHDDIPVAVVVPYQEYQQLVLAAKYRSDPHKYAVPQEVAEMILIKNYTPIKAWRIHRKFSQAQMAQRLEITQAAFSQIEKSKKNQAATLKKVAAALRIAVKQLQLSD